jgi:uncharacterized protein
LALAFVGSGFHISMGNYDPHLLLLLASGGVAGAVAGSMLAGKIAQRPLRLALLVVLILLGGQLCYRGLNQNRENRAASLAPARMVAFHSNH